MFGVIGRCALGVLGVGVLMLGTAAGAPWAARSGLQRIGAGGPEIDLSAVRGEGELAVVSSGVLYLIDGTLGTVRRVPPPPGSAALDPRYSPDGKWVSYETQADGGNGAQAPPVLWIARADGGGRQRITGAAGVFGWSPAADLLAISLDTSVRFPGGSRGAMPTRIDLVAPTGTRRRLVTLTGAAEGYAATGYRIWNAVWSPTGDAIAASLVSYRDGSSVRSYPIDGGKKMTWFSINGKAALPGVCSGCGGGGTIADLAGWWPQWGVGFWVFSSGMVHNNDETPLELVHTPGVTPHLIGWTLSDGTTDAIAASPTGALAIVSAIGGGRDYGRGKSIEACALDHETCAPIPDATVWAGPNSLRCSGHCLPAPPTGQPGSAVSLDPAWSPTQNLLAYVKSPDALNGGNPWPAWFNAHRLYLYNPSTSRSTEIPDIHGASVPTWSANGTQILYVADDALWLAPATGDRTVEIATPLYPKPQLAQDAGLSISYYGQVNWAGQFDWWSGGAHRKPSP